MKVGNNTGNGKVYIDTNYECRDNCTACSSGSICTACIANHYLYKVLSVTKCIKPCPEGTKTNSSTKTCDKCSVSLCAQCNSIHAQNVNIITICSQINAMINVQN